MMDEVDRTATSIEDRKSPEYRELKAGLWEMESFWRNIRDHSEPYDYEALDEELKNLLSRMGMNFMDSRKNDINGRGLTTFLLDRAVILVVDRQVRRRTPSSKEYVFIQLERINLGLHIPAKGA